MNTMTNPGRPPTAPRRPRSRRARTVRRLVIALVVLLGLLVAADFGAAAIFEHEVSKRARAQFGLEHDPSVRVHGFSFLLQALSGEYEFVEVDATGVPVQDKLRDLDVEADLRGVHAPLGELMSGSARVTVREAEGRVTVKTSDVSRAIAQSGNEALRTITEVSIDPVSEAVAKAETKEEAEEAERLPAQAPEPEDTTAGARICFTADVAGASTDLCAFGIIALVQEKITFDANLLEYRNALASGALAPAIRNGVIGALSTINLDPGVLPFKVTPTAVKVEVGKLSVKGIAENVLLSGG